MGIRRDGCAGSERIRRSASAGGLMVASRGAGTVAALRGSEGTGAPESARSASRSMATFFVLVTSPLFCVGKILLFVCTCEPFFSHEQRGRRTSCSYGATSQVNSFPKTSTSLKGFVTSQKLPNLPIHAPGVVRVGIGRFSIQCTPGGDLRDTHQTDHVYESQEPNRLRASRLTDSRANAATAPGAPTRQPIQKRPPPDATGTGVKRTRSRCYATGGYNIQIQPSSRWG